MSVYKVDICGVTTSKLPVLKDDEKEELFEKIKKGDKAAREKIYSWKFKAGAFGNQKVFKP